MVSNTDTFLTHFLHIHSYVVLFNIPNKVYVLWLRASYITNKRNTTIVGSLSCCMKFYMLNINVLISYTPLSTF